MIHFVVHEPGDVVGVVVVEGVKAGNDLTGGHGRRYHAEYEIRERYTNWSQDLIEGFKCWRYRY